MYGQVMALRQGEPEARGGASDTAATRGAEVVDELLACVNAWQGGDYGRVPTGSDPLSAALRGFVESLASRRGNELSQAVGLSVALNDTAAVFVDLGADLRLVDEQTQSSAAAAEELQVTNADILRTTRGIADGAAVTRDKMLHGARNLMESITRIDRIVVATNLVQEKVDALQELSKQVRRISATISQIASQTKLLALNATIEAARAGESGRGFTVVAGEVKELAQETARATVEIEEIIARIQHETAAIAETADANHRAVNDGQSAIRGVADEIVSVRDHVDSMATEVEHIARIMVEQQTASAQVSESVSRIAALTSKSVGGLGHVVDAVDVMEARIVERLNQLAKLEVPHKVIRLAQSDHVIWKKRLLMMMMGRTQLDPNELADSHG